MIFTLYEDICDAIDYIFDINISLDIDPLLSKLADILPDWLVKLLHYVLIGIVFGVPGLAVLVTHLSLLEAFPFTMVAYVIPLQIGFVMLVYCICRILTGLEDIEFYDKVCAVMRILFYIILCIGSVIAISNLLK